MTNTTLENDQKLIQEAIELLEEKRPGLKINMDDFNCKIWRNSHSVAVDFTRIIRFVPIGRQETDFEYDIVVNLSNKTILPFEDPFFSGEFFIPTEEDLKALDFIKEHFGGFSSEFENTIVEEAEQYNISCTNEASYGFYSIDKRTGEQGPTIQGSYILPPGPDSEASDKTYGIDN